MGDEVQAIKAGLLEVADLVVVNKGDRPGRPADGRAAAGDARAVRGRVRGSARDADPARPGSPGPKRPEVLVTTAVTGEGIPELLVALDRHRAAAPGRGHLRSPARPGGRAGSGACWWSGCGSGSTRRPRPGDGCGDRRGRRTRAGSLRGGRSPPGRPQQRGAGMSIERVFVAGAGLMGHGIAQVHAAVGKRVSLYEPDLARAEARARRGSRATSIGPSPRGRSAPEERDAILARVTATDDLAAAARCRPGGRGRVRGRRRQDPPVGVARRDRAGGRPLRLQHLVDLHRHPGRRRRRAASRPVRRDALLQPGAGDAADRADPRLGDLGRHGGRDPRPGRRAGQAGDRVCRPAGVHRQPDPDAVPRGGDAGLRGGPGHGRGHRHGREGGAQPPDGPAGAGGLHRARRVPRGDAGAARRAWGSRSSRRRRCSWTWSRRGTSARRRAAGSTSIRGSAPRSIGCGPMGSRPPCPPS